MTKAVEILRDTSRELRERAEENRVYDEDARAQLIIAAAQIDEIARQFSSQLSRRAEAEEA